jgi:5-hydroxyisourate hydrolase
MNAITTHVLDTVLGKPAAGVQIGLEQRVGDAWKTVGESLTDDDGRCRDLAQATGEGTYRLIFATGEYLSQQGRSTIYPEIVIVFACSGDAHYHLPLLLSDNGYTAYRGS